MNAEIFAEWFRRQGRHIYRTARSYWHDAGHRIFQAFSYHWIIEPTEKEIKKLLWGKNVLALRYSAPITAANVMKSYHIVCEHPGYCLLSLRRQARQNVQRGLDYASIEPISLSRLATEGWKLRLHTLKRQGRADAENEEWWRHLCMSAQDLPGFEAWGAIRDGQLIAGLLAFICDDCYLLLYEQSSTAHLKGRVNNAIFFYVTLEALKRNGISRVFLGLQSLDAPSSLDHFKIRMGYTAKLVGQRVVFHSLFSSFASGITYELISALRQHYRNSNFLAKAEGILRFYRQGNRLSCEQTWPEWLNEGKADLSKTEPSKK